MATDHFLDRQFYFDGLEKRQLLIQRCTNCQHARFPAIPICNRCKSKAWEPVPAGGGGALYSFITMRRPQLPGLMSPLVGVISLDEGVRVVSSLVGIEPEDVRFDMRLEMDFMTNAAGRTVHVFQPSVS